MIRSLLKWMLIVFVILMAGQISVEGNTIARHVQVQASRALGWSEKKLVHSSAYSNVARSEYVPNWVKNKLKEARKSSPEETSRSKYSPRTAGGPDEEIEPADRESLLHLLQ